MRPYILVTNDDGVDAPGIIELTQTMQEIGDVLVVAPDVHRSGQSSAITVGTPLRAMLLEKSEGLTRYACSGTPTDCVKLAFNSLIERTPDVVVSGINHGSNAAVNVIYSGTMGAAMEGSQHGVPSIGFSILDHAHDADFSHFLPFVKQITEEIIHKGLPNNVCLNVNAPKGALKGAEVVRQCKGRWVKEFEKRQDPYGMEYFWLTGRFENEEPDARDTDEWVLSQGYVSIVPTSIDMTAYEELDKMKDWDFEAAELAPNHRQNSYNSSEKAK